MACAQGDDSDLAAELTVCVCVHVLLFQVSLVLPVVPEEGSDLILELSGDNSIFPVIFDHAILCFQSPVSYCFSYEEISCFTREKY